MIAKHAPHAAFLNSPMKAKGIWWFHLNNILRPSLPTSWKVPSVHLKLIQRTTPYPGVFDSYSLSDLLSSDSQVYINTIGLPRDIPDDYKVCNQVSGGFSSALPFFRPNDWSKKEHQKD